MLLLPANEVLGRQCFQSCQSFHSVWSQGGGSPRVTTHGPVQTCSLVEPLPALTPFRTRVPPDLFTWSPYIYQQAVGCSSTERPSCFSGVITNAKKTIQTGKIVGSFAFGTKKLYDFMDNNPFVGKFINSGPVTCLS